MEHSKIEITGSRLPALPDAPAGDQEYGAADEQATIDARLVLAMRSSNARRAGMNAAAATGLCLVSCMLPFLPGSLAAVPFAALASVLITACALAVDRVFRCSCPRSLQISASFSLIPAPATARLAPVFACLASALCAIVLPAPAALALAVMAGVALAVLAAASPNAGCAVSAILSPIRLIEGYSAWHAVPLHGRMSFLLLARGPALPKLSAPLAVRLRFACPFVACGCAL